MIELKKDNNSISLNKQMLKGDSGGYYIPSVTSYGVLSWTPSKEDMPDVQGSNIKGRTGDKGEKGADGFSPIVAIQPIENGNKLYITDTEGTKSIDILNGKDGEKGTAVLTVKSLYFPNTWEQEEGALYNDSLTARDVSFCLIEPMIPENTQIIDVGIRWGNEDLSIGEMKLRNLVTPTAILHINRKPHYSEEHELYFLATLTDLASGCKFYNDVAMTNDYVQGFTVYYIEVNEE